VAGTVEAVGLGVTRFRPGDAVFGDLSEHGYGGFAEYVAGPESAFAAKPEGVSFEAAAAVPTAAVTAYQALQAGRELRPGDHVAVNGASGGVGTFAVQIAKALGAEVTGVCSTRNVELVRGLGADHVVDYTQDDFVAGRRYDRIVDAAAFRSILDYRHALDPDGVYVLVGGAPGRTYQAMLLGPILSRKGVRKMLFFIMQPNPDDLEAVRDLVAAGRVTPVLDRSYALDQVPDAIRYLEAGHARGKVTIRVAEA
jgi:NADPH:quinone reductase-like Zn-dependent oxidoreductase